MNWRLEVACAALTLAAAAPILGGGLPDGVDVRRFDLPLAAAVGDALRDGEQFVWHPDLSLGYHALGGGQSLAAYPPFLLLLLLRLGPEATLALHALLHLHLLGRGAAGAARALGAGQRGALLTAAAVLLGGQTATLLPHASALVGAAWLPALVALTPGAARGGPRPTLLLAGAWGLAGLGASPPFLWYAVVASLVTGAALAGPRGLARAAAAGAAGAALAAPALAPVLGWAASNPRGPAGDRLAWFTVGSLDLGGLLRLLVPGPGPLEARAPLGAAAAALALGRVAAGGALREPLARAGVWLVVAGGLLAAPLEPVQRAMAALPIVGLFRCPTRYLLVAQLGVGLLAASALRAGRLRPTLAAAGLLGLLALAGLAARPLAAGLALLGLAAAPAALAWPRARPLVLAALLLELGVAWRDAVPFADREALARPPAILAPALPGARLLDLVDERDAPPPSWTPARANGGARWGAAYLLGYDSLAPRAVLGIEAGLRRTLRERPAAFPAACAERSVDFVLAPGALAGLPEAAREGELRLLRVPDPRPDVYVVPPAALVGETVDTAGQPAAPVEPRSLGRTRRAVLAEGPGAVVFAQTWHPGWEGTVDGAPVELLVADLLVLAVPIGPGRHEVVVTFDDPWVDAGLGLGLACWLGLAAAWARSGRGA